MYQPTYKSNIVVYKFEAVPNCRGPIAKIVGHKT